MIGLMAQRGCDWRLFQCSLCLLTVLSFLSNLPLKGVTLSDGLKDIIDYPHAHRISDHSMFLASLCYNWRMAVLKWYVTPYLETLYKDRRVTIRIEIRVHFVSNSTVTSRANRRLLEWEKVVVVFTGRVGTLKLLKLYIFYFLAIVIWSMML